MWGWNYIIEISKYFLFYCKLLDNTFICHVGCLHLAPRERFQEWLWRQAGAKFRQGAKKTRKGHADAFEVWVSDLLTMPWTKNFEAQSSIVCRLVIQGINISAPMQDRRRLRGCLSDQYGAFAPSNRPINNNSSSSRYCRFRSRLPCLNLAFNEPLWPLALFDLVFEVLTKKSPDYDTRVSLCIGIKTKSVCIHLDIMQIRRLVLSREEQRESFGLVNM